EATPQAPSSTSPAAATGAASDENTEEVWCPIPCPGCSALLGSIPLVFNPPSSSSGSSSSSSSSASLGHMQVIRPSPARPEMRFFKFQLSNCFRKKERDDGNLVAPGKSAAASSALTAFSSPWLITNAKACS